MKPNDRHEEFAVEVAYALPERQLILSLQAHAGMRLDEAVRRSGILERFPEIDLERSRIGVFGKLRRPDEQVRPGDRIEIYRPLIADPKESRRRRAARPR
ncbi:RnfH family protein [Acidihalobacter prosperus]